jgi:hypothetical protein
MVILLLLLMRRKSSLISSSFRGKFQILINQSACIPSDTILEPTGRLSLRIQNYFAGQRTISDGKVQLLEECLNNFILLLVKTSEIEKIRTQRAAERDRLWEEERQKQREIQLEIEQEEQMLKDLLDNAVSWNKCKMAKEYIAAVAESSDGDEVDWWVKWAGQQLDRIEHSLLEPKDK